MKSILVIDTPKACVECPLQHLGNRFVCKATDRWCGDEKGYFTSETKPTWCPLRPLPKKEEKPTKGEDDYNDFCIGYTRGWNDCLETLEDSQNWEDSNE